MLVGSVILKDTKTGELSEIAARRFHKRGISSPHGFGKSPGRSS